MFQKIKITQSSPNIVCSQKMKTIRVFCSISSAFCYRKLNNITNRCLVCYYLTVLRQFVFQHIPNEKAKKELSDIESLTEQKVDELVQEFVKDLKEDTLEARGWPLMFSAYIVSKAALNGYTRVLAKNYPNMAINALSPGFVKTDLNHNTGILTVEQGAKGPVMLALVPDGGPSGLFYDQMEVSTF